MVEMLCFWLHSEDRTQVWKLHPLLGKGDLLVADRGLCSYVHLAMLSLLRSAGVVPHAPATDRGFPGATAEPGQGTAGSPARATWIAWASTTSGSIGSSRRSGPRG